MDEQVVMEEIVKNLAFEVKPTSTKDIDQDCLKRKNVLSLMLKVRKKEIKIPISQGFISNKLSEPEMILQKVRLVNNDETIASFDMLVEKQYMKKLLQKYDKTLLNKDNLGLQIKTADDNYQMLLPMSDHNIHISEDESMNQQYRYKRLSKNNYKSFITGNKTRTQKTFLGTKCKSGGCLDPPFDEDIYAYKYNAVHDPNQLIELKYDDLNTEINSNTSYTSKKNIRSRITTLKSTEMPKEISNDSYLNINLDRIESCESSLITYPPNDEINSINNGNNKKEKISISKQSTEDKSKQKVDDSVYSFFTLPKGCKRGSVKDNHKMNFEDKSTTNNISENIYNISCNVSSKNHYSDINLHKIESQDYIAKKYTFDKETNIDTRRTIEENINIIFSRSSNDKNSVRSNQDPNKYAQKLSTCDMANRSISNKSYAEILKANSDLSFCVKLSTGDKLSSSDIIVCKSESLKKTLKEIELGQSDQGSNKCAPKLSTCDMANRSISDKSYAEILKANSDLSCCIKLSTGDKLSSSDIIVCKSDSLKNTLKEINHTKVVEVISGEKVEFESKPHSDKNLTPSINECQSTDSKFSKKIDQYTHNLYQKELINFKMDNTNNDVKWDFTSHVNCDKFIDLSKLVKSSKVDKHELYSDTCLYKKTSQSNLLETHSALEITNIYVPRTLIKREHSKFELSNEDRSKETINKTISNISTTQKISENGTIKLPEILTTPLQISSSTSCISHKQNVISNNVTNIQTINMKLVDNHIQNIQSPFFTEHDQIAELTLDMIAQKISQNIENNMLISESTMSIEGSLQHKTDLVNKSHTVLSGETLESENTELVIDSKIQDIQVDPLNIESNIMKSFYSEKYKLKSDENITLQQQKDDTVNMKTKDDINTKDLHTVSSFHDAKEIVNKSLDLLEQGLDQVTKNTSNNKEYISMNSSSHIMTGKEIKNNENLNTIQINDVTEKELNNNNQKLVTLTNIDQNISYPKDIDQPTRIEIQQHPLDQYTNNKFFISEKRDTLKSSAENFRTVRERVDTNIELESNKQSNNKKPSSITLDLTFHSYSNDKNQTIIKTIKDENHLTRHPTDSIIVMKLQLKLPFNNDYQEICAPLDSEHNITIKIKKNNSKRNDACITRPTRTATQTSISEVTNKFHDEAKYHTDKVDSTLTDIYERDLLPLQILIRNLKHEIDALAKQQTLFKKKVLCVKQHEQSRQA